MKSTSVSNSETDIQFPAKKESFKQLRYVGDLVGQKLFMRTVTYHLVGKVEKKIGDFLILSDASWVASSGRFSNAIKNGTLDEVEHLGTWMINVNTITDMGPWNHSLDF